MEKKTATDHFLLDKVARIRLRASFADFAIANVVGKGQFGIVYRARHNASGVLLALKVVKKDNLSEYNGKERLEAEIEIQNKLRHERILRMKGFFEDEKRVYLVLQYAEKGDLYHYLKQKKRLSERESSIIIRQLSEALIYCHGQNVIHRDIKPENVLLDKNHNVLLADFGWSAQSNVFQQRSTLCGTPDYLAPEMLLIGENSELSPKYDHRVDVWAVGIMCFELVAGRTPFGGSTVSSTVNHIRNYTFKVPLHFTNRLTSLVRKLVVADPDGRIPLTQVLTDPWIKYFENNAYIPSQPTPVVTFIRQAAPSWVQMGKSVQPTAVVLPPIAVNLSSNLKIQEQMDSVKEEKEKTLPLVETKETLALDETQMVDGEEEEDDEMDCETAIQNEYTEESNVSCNEEMMLDETQCSIA